MGSKLGLESLPTLRGSTPKKDEESQNYFERVKSIQHQNFIDKIDNEENLKSSLMLKNFKNNPCLPKYLDDFTWQEYIENYLDTVIEANHYRWCSELLLFIQSQSFFTENKYTSTFFYNEFLLQTKPDVLNDGQDIDNDKDIIDVDKFGDNFNTGPINLDELDVSANFGGSYLELNIDDLVPDELTLKYQRKRKQLKKYIKIFKEHIEKNYDHPIMIVINAFIKLFCKYINDKTKELDNQLKNNEISIEQFHQNIKNFEGEVTKSLQDFITHMHCTLKLFYYKAINYSCFQEEKDDLMNWLITLFFKTGNLYETIYKLYNLSFTKEIQEFQDKLLALRNVKPKNLEIKIKFCLDEDTLEMQQEILKKKEEEKGKNKEKDKIIIKKEENIINPLLTIKENEEDEKDEDNDNIINTNTNTNIITNFNKSKIESIKKDGNDDMYLLERINTDLFEESMNENVHDISNIPQVRNTVNCFNTKTFLYPKLHKKLRDTISEKNFYIKEVKNVGSLPVPYLSAIKLLASLKKYKAPFEKIVILAALSDQITESATTFWSDMEKYIKDDFLSIESDDLIPIFLFIVIKCQMPEIIIYEKMISNFTTPSTRSFNLSYNFAMIEIAIQHLQSLKDLKKLIKNDDNPLRGIRNSLNDIANKRLSKLDNDDVI